ncbi:Putative transporter YycB [Marinicrinis lubricantis]
MRIGFSLILLTAGIALRSIPSVTALFTGTLILGAAIAIGNVLLPGLIKRDFPGNVGLMTGAYSVSMNTFAAFASGITVPISEDAGLGWRGALACWVFLSLLALIVWLPQLRKVHHGGDTGKRDGAIWRSKLAWQVALFMGLQSLLFYVTIAWFPEILRERGMSEAAAGWMLSLLQFVSLPASFIIPILAGRSSNQRRLVTSIVLMSAVGYVGMLIGGLGLIWLWMILIGFAGGAYISLALTFMGLRTNSAQKSAELSGMAQSIGYLIASVGPLLFCFFHDITNDWSVGLGGLLIVSALVFVAGMGAGRDAVVEDDLKSTANSTAKSLT